MKIFRKTIIVLLILLSVDTALGWGPKGHNIIAYMAECNVSNKTKKAVTKALNGHTFVYYSSWMDEIRETEEYKHTFSWHFANVDEGKTYDEMEHNKNGDTYTALTSIIKTLKEHRNTGDSVEKLYVKFLIHLVADLHCPMHLGRATDMGGNQFEVMWEGQKTNLHYLWDVPVVENSRKWSYSEWRNNVDFFNKWQKGEVCQGGIKEWLNETSNICKQIYMEAKPGQEFDAGYALVKYPVLEGQLQKAAYRLAYILDSIYK